MKYFKSIKINFIEAVFIIDELFGVADLEDENNYFDCLFFCLETKEPKIQDPKTQLKIKI